MQPIRRARLESVIREELSLMISREIKDPRVGNVTITQVALTPDGSHATVSILLLGDDESSPELEAGIAGLNSAAGFLRRSLSKALNVRHVPELHFKADRGISNVFRVNELLNQIKPGSSE